MCHCRTSRVVRADLVADRVVEVNAVVSRGCDEHNSTLLCVAGGGRDCLDDRLLLSVVAAVEQPWISEEAHVDGVKVLVTGVAQCIDHGLREEVTLCCPRF